MRALARLQHLQPDGRAAERRAQRVLEVRPVEGDRVDLSLCGPTRGPCERGPGCSTRSQSAGCAGGAGGRALLASGGETRSCRRARVRGALTRVPRVRDELGQRHYHVTWTKGATCGGGGGFQGSAGACGACRGRARRKWPARPRTRGACHEEGHEQGHEQGYAGEARGTLSSLEIQGGQDLSSEVRGLLFAGLSPSAFSKERGAAQLDPRRGASRRRPGRGRSKAAALLLLRAVGGGHPSAPEQTPSRRENVRTSPLSPPQPSRSRPDLSSVHSCIGCRLHHAVHLSHKPRGLLTGPPQYLAICQVLSLALLQWQC